jgi:hypothetical protein
LGVAGEEGQVQWLKPVILASQEAEIRRIKIRGQPRQKHETSLNQWLGTVVHTCYPGYTVKHSQEDLGPDQLGIK